MGKVLTAPAPGPIWLDVRGCKGSDPLSDCSGPAWGQHNYVITRRTWGSPALVRGSGAWSGGGARGGGARQESHGDPGRGLQSRSGKDS